MEDEIAIPMSEKSCPASSFTKRRGRKTNTVVIVPESTAVQTFPTPSRAASKRDLPLLRSIARDVHETYVRLHGRLREVLTRLLRERGAR